MIALCTKCFVLNVIVASFFMLTVQKCGVIIFPDTARNTLLMIQNRFCQTPSLIQMGHWLYQISVTHCMMVTWQSVYSLCTCYFILFYLIFVCYCFLYPFIRSSFCWACHVRWYLKRKGYGRRLVWNLKSRWLTYFELSCSHVICAAEISSDSKNWMSLPYGNFCTLNLTVLLILFFYCLIWLNSAWRLSQSLEEI